ncbi:hypothetical protein Back11_18080 [Paenibacillus baekrokdamisoli]|uniref:Uncharacterized protein n=1 Tax=Paenibacillus baekrokdamisoli TaxID=1712516 RepID=A0A3G9J6K7_9BACL|nr:hypothetical protein [Paenibacillus baekrokdamisoli]MBB3072402.1 hypothetical protein [Paenibacillus baekrokdamisoli]BBH20463.1 hypothetical protein Back11_18080 [Paenibacillus baekrokdamisoli]
MSYDLTVYLKALDDSKIQQWINEIKKFDMDVEIHPDFSFSNHSGFLPFKFTVIDCPNKRLNNIELMSGFELWINDYKPTKNIKSFWKVLFQKERRLNSIERKLKESSKEITFTASTQDSFEFRLAWYSAAALANIFDGVLSDPQEGIEIDGDQSINYAFEQVIKDEKAISENEWRIHEFKEWLG